MNFDNDFVRVLTLQTDAQLPSLIADYGDSKLIVVQLTCSEYVWTPRPITTQNYHLRLKLRAAEAAKWAHVDIDSVTGPNSSDGQSQPVVKILAPNRPDFDFEAYHGDVLTIFMEDIELRLREMGAVSFLEMDHSTTTTSTGDLGQLDQSSHAKQRLLTNDVEGMSLALEGSDIVRPLFKRRSIGEAITLITKGSSKVSGQEEEDAYPDGTNDIDELVKIGSTGTIPSSPVPAQALLLHSRYNSQDLEALFDYVKEIRDDGQENEEDAKEQNEAAPMLPPSPVKPTATTFNWTPVFGTIGLVAALALSHWMGHQVSPAS